MKVNVTIDVSDQDRLIIAEAFDAQGAGFASRGAIKQFIIDTYENTMGQPRAIYQEERDRRMEMVKDSLGMLDAAPLPGAGTSGKATSPNS